MRLDSTLSMEANYTSLYDTATTEYNDSATTTAAEGAAGVLLGQFYIYGVAGSAISVLGLLGNVLSMVVLSQRRMRSTTSSYLLALAAVDALVLVSLFVCFSLPMLNTTFRTQHYARINRVAYPLALTAQTSSIYMTVAFTVERYMAVTRPLNVTAWSPMRRTRCVIALVIVLSIIYNIPRAFEKTTRPHVYAGNVTGLGTANTELGENALYKIIYHMACYMLVMLFVPFVLLVYLNFSLLRAVRHSQRSTGRCSTPTHDNNLTLMLVAVVACFLLCQLPSIVNSIIQAVKPPEYVLRSPALVRFMSVSNLFVVLNSAVNFYLYCCFGQKFRRQLWIVVCKCRCSSKSEQQLSYRESGGINNEHGVSFRHRAPGSFRRHHDSRTFSSSSGRRDRNLGKHGYASVKQQA